MTMTMTMTMMMTQWKGWWQSVL